MGIRWVPSKRGAPHVAILLLSCLLVGSAQAVCWEEAGARYGIDPTLLMAVAWQESRGRPDAVGPLLDDGNRAIGLMQINTIHLPALSRFGITRENLFDACVSQQVGAWVLADCMRRFGNTWKALGCYYAGPASKAVTAQAAYASDVERHYLGYLTQQGKLAPAAGRVAMVSLAQPSSLKRLP